MTRFDETRACPDPDVLHQFLGGELDPQTADSIASHVETCRDCSFIIRESSEFLREEEEPEEPEEESPVPSGRARLVGLAAAFLVTLLLLPFWYGDRGREFDRELERAPLRLSEARLSGVPYARHRRLLGPSTQIPLRLQILAEEVSRRTPASAATWNRQGRAFLVQRNCAASLQSFERAAQLRPRQSRYWSDLSAAYIGCAGTGADDERLLAAIAAARRAVELDPQSASARFNLAVGLDRLGNHAEASAAYIDYLALDPSSAWADEVRQRKSEISH